MRPTAYGFMFTAFLVVGCGPDPPKGDPAAARPRVDTAYVTIGDVQYVAKIDGTLHLPGSQIDLTVTASPAGTSPPAVTRVELIVTPEGSVDVSARAAVPLRWVAREGRWEADIRNAFPDPEFERSGRSWTPGPYFITVEFFDGEGLAGRAGPIEVYLHFVRTSG